MDRLRLPCLALVATLAASAVESAELVVIASTAEGVPAGQIIDGSKSLNLGKGASVALVAASGAIVKIEGPYAGAPEARLPTPVSPSGDSRLLAALSRLLATKDSERTAAMRSPPAMPGSEPEAWEVDITRAGEHCALPDVAVSLWRPSKDRAERLRLRTEGTGSAVALDWPRDARTLPWPAALPVRDGATYAASLERAKIEARIVIRVVPKDLPSDPHRAAWMADNGCPTQALRMLTGLAR